MAPVREASLPVAGGGRSLEAAAVGTTPDYRDAARLALAKGRFLAPLDLQDRKRVAVLGAHRGPRPLPLRRRAGRAGVVGGRLVPGRGGPRGAGVVPAASRGPIRTRDVNRCVFVPWSALDRGADARPDGVDELVVRVAVPDRVGATAEVVRALLARATGGTAFDVIVPREILRQRERTQRSSTR